jgi:hypothetical protein
MYVYILVVFIATQKFSVVQTRRLYGLYSLRDWTEKEARVRKKLVGYMALESFFLSLDSIHVLRTNPLKAWVKKGLYIR